MRYWQVGFGSQLLHEGVSSRPCVLNNMSGWRKGLSREPDRGGGVGQQDGHQRRGGLQLRPHQLVIGQNNQLVIGSNNLLTFNWFIVQCRR